MLGEKSFLTRNPIAVAVNKVVSDSILSVIWDLAGKLDETNSKISHMKAYEAYNAVVEAIIDNHVERASSL